jgi:hypothetical protein
MLFWDAWPWQSAQEGQIPGDEDPEVIDGPRGSQDRKLLILQRLFDSDA